MPSSSDLNSQYIRIVFASGPPRLVDGMVARFCDGSDLALYVVSEFAPSRGIWIPFHPLRKADENLASIRAVVGDRRVAVAVAMMSASHPYAELRAVAREVAGARLLVWDEDLRPVGRFSWVIRRIFANLASPRALQWYRRIVRPWEMEIPVRARLAQMRGVSIRARKPAESRPQAGVRAQQEGVSVVIPSRDGRELLSVCLPPLLSQIPAGEIIVCDNGSSDSTAGWLASSFPSVRVIESQSALSFARAVNSGLSAARFSRVLLLNNDMIVEPGFIAALNEAFDRIPDLFCATAQIFFPPGVRREETGKAVWRQEGPLDFPVRCDDPVEGENFTWVLYGSGGCSLFDADKLRALGGVEEDYDPAYVEDLDLGYRAWKLGWPSVYCAGAKVEHRHRATTSRFFTARQLDAFVEINYLRFLALAVGDPELFRRLWREAIRRLQLRGALDALRSVPRIGSLPEPASGVLSESEILALGNGDAARFPGHAARRGRTLLIVSPYLPFPLSHGGAVRIYNLMREAAAGWDIVLLTFAEALTAPAPELLTICRDAILVKRHGTHYKRDTPRPDRVEEFDSECFRACLKQAVHEFQPEIVQLEFTQMAQYAEACAPAKTLLVEHDITFDLEEQLAALEPENWERQQQLRKWKDFEVPAWSAADCVVTMSRKDEAVVTGAQAVVCIPNGVDTGRFAPAHADPEPKRLLFIGSFAHKPNAMAMEFFLRDVWPLLGPGYRLHAIAGHAAVSLENPAVELEGFVADVRPAYRRAEIVIAPLTASAGTNIKILEAMAMGRAIVSTPAGINGLDLSPGEDILVAREPADIAAAIEKLSSDPALRRKIEQAARATALRFDWREIGRVQSELYDSLTA